MVTSRLLLLGCRGDLEDVTSPAVPFTASVDALDADNDDDRTVAPPFLGIDDPADLPALLLPLLLLLQLLMVMVATRDAGDLADDGDASLSVGDNDDVTATASCRKMRSLRRRYHSSA